MFSLQAHIRRRNKNSTAFLFSSIRMDGKIYSRWVSTLVFWHTAQAHVQRTYNLLETLHEQSFCLHSGYWKEEPINIFLFSLEKQMQIFAIEMKLEKYVRNEFWPWCVDTCGREMWRMYSENIHFAWNYTRWIISKMRPTFCEKIKCETFDRNGEGKICSRWAIALSSDLGMAINSFWYLTKE